MQRAATYCRVSSADQVKGFGLDVQDEKVRGLCELSDYSLLERHVYCDEGESGAREDRPALLRMIDAAKQHEFDVLVIPKLDRLGRDTTETLYNVRELERAGISVKSASEPFDTTTPMGKAAFQMSCVWAEAERGIIRERTLGGQIKNKQQGNWVSGIPPYGYDYDKTTKRLVINEKEMEIVKKIFNWVVAERCTVHRIQSYLHDMRVPTKFDNIGRRPAERFGIWKKKTISRILRNEVYTGSYTYNKYQGSEPGHALRPESDWIMIETPEIITPALFKAAQLQVRSNKKHASRNAKRIYLLSGLLECKCGGKFNGVYEVWRKSVSDIQRRRYFCNRSRREIKSERCKAATIAEHLLSEPIWTSLTSFLKNPDVAFRQLEVINKRSISDEDAKKKLTDLGILIRQNQQKQKRLLDLYLEGMEKRGYLSKKGELEKDEERLRGEMHQYEEILESESDLESKRDAVQALYGKIKNNLSKITYEQKREILKMLVNKIVVNGKALDIFCAIPNPFHIVEQSTRPRRLAPSDSGRAR